MAGSILSVVWFMWLPMMVRAFAATELLGDMGTSGDDDSTGSGGVGVFRFRSRPDYRRGPTGRQKPRTAGWPAKSGPAKCLVSVRDRAEFRRQEVARGACLVCPEQLCVRVLR